jgi:hypothetical protein
VPTDLPRDELSRFYQARWHGVRGEEIRAFLELVILVGSVGGRLLNDHELALAADLIHRIWSHR